MSGLDFVSSAKEPSATSPHGFRERIPGTELRVELRRSFYWYLVDAAGRIKSKRFNSRLAALRSVQS